MKTITKNIKMALIALFATIMAVCIFFATSLTFADKENTKVRIGLVENTGFENYASSLTDGYMSFPTNTVTPYFGGITATAATSGETVGIVNNAYTNNSTAIRFWGGYLMYQFKESVYGKPVAGLNYNVSFDAAAGNTSSANNFLAGFTPSLVVYYTNTSNTANQVFEVSLGEESKGLFYAKNPDGASASVAQWNDIQVSFNYVVNENNQLILNSTWGDDATAKSNTLAQITSNRENYVVGENVKEVTEIQFRIKGSGNNTLAQIYIDNVEIYTEFDVNSDLFAPVGNNKTPIDGELISDGNMSTAPAVGTELTSTTALNAKETVYVVPSEVGSRGVIVDNSYSKGKALELSAGAYINIRVSEMTEGAYFDFSYDVKISTESDKYNKIASVYNGIVLYDINGAYFADLRLEATEDGAENKNGRIYPITKKQQTFGKYFLNNYEKSLANTFENVYAGTDFCDWSTVTYRIWYEYNDNDELILHAKRITNNSDSDYTIYSNQGDQNPELVINCGNKIYAKAELRIRCDLGPVLIDNFSLKEVEREYSTNVTVLDENGTPVSDTTVTLLNQGGEYKTDAEGKVTVSSKYSDYVIVKKDGYMISQKYISASNSEILINLTGTVDFDFINQYGNNAKFGDFETTSDYYWDGNQVEHNAFMEFITFGESCSLSDESIIGDHSLCIDMQERGTRCAFRGNYNDFEYGVKYIVSGYMKTDKGVSFSTKPTLTVLYKEYNDGNPGICIDLDNLMVGKEQINVSGEWQYFEFWFELNLENCEDYDMEPIVVETSEWTETFDRVLTVRTSFWDTVPMVSEAIFYEQMYIEPGFFIYKGQKLYVDGVSILPEYEAKALVYLNEGETADGLSFTVTDAWGKETEYTNLTPDDDGLYSFGNVCGPVTVTARLGSEVLGTDIAYFKKNNDNSIATFYPDFDCKVTVVDEKGRKLTGVTVTSWIGDANVTFIESETGVYTATGLDGNEEYFVKAVADNYKQNNITVTFFENNVTITLKSKNSSSNEQDNPTPPVDGNDKESGGCGSNVVSALPIVGIVLVGVVVLLTNKKAKIHKINN